MVEDVGCDPTGTEPCDEQITDAADDYTLLKFPAGEYKLTQKNVILDKTNLGFVGTGDVRFTVPERFNEKVLVVDRGTGLLFEGIDIDQTANGATPGLHLGVDDDLRVHDVELIGQGIHPESIPREEPGWEPGGADENGNPNVMDYFYPIVRSPDGTGLVTDLKANNHGLMGTYNAGDGRSGIWVGISNRGTVTFRNCRIEEFGSNGTYTSRTNGVVQFEGGVYRNNDNNQVRIGSAGSYVDGVTLEVDADASDAPNPYEALNYRGVRIEMGRQSDRTDVEIRDCDISIRSASFSGGGVVAEATASEFQVRNTRIGIEENSVRGVFGKEPDGGGAYDPPAKPHAGTMEDVSITGSAGGNAAIELRDRPDSTVDGCCIHQKGANRDGVVLLDSDGSTVRNSTIDITGEQVVEDDSLVTISDIVDEGSCPTPDDSGGSGLPHELSIKGTDERFSYTFSVSGNLEKSTANGATIDDNDTLTDYAATGQGGDGGIDSYAFSGSLESFALDGEANVTLDGEPANVGQRPDHVLSIEGTDERFSYTFSVSGDLEKSTANGATIDDNDTISGNTATGQGGDGGIDSYVFSGELTNFDLDGEANITLDGEPARVGQRPDHVLSIEGTDERFSYTFSVGDDLEKSTSNGATIDDNDTITDYAATGQGGDGGIDSYAFSGSLESFALDGEANVTLDGEPARVGQRPDHVLSIEGTDERFSYTFSVSGDLEKSTANGATIDDNDTLTDYAATGQGGDGGIDSYVFSGDLESFALDGEANVTLDGEPAHVGQRSDHVLSIEGTDERFSYTFSVSGNLEKSTANGATNDDNDTISGNTATGQGGDGGIDSYVFSGELTSFDLDGEANVTLDGEPAHVGQRPDHYLSTARESRPEAERSDG
ncbi:hypothetical protein [Halococcus sp. AFM35]|uniref:hypothetical protein n=1 Tax=Halococcus sp. AFM35 TaxID=3421653 RepID=UPI003EBC4304